MATYQFAVSTDPGSYGLVQNFSTSESGDLGEARDTNGDVKDINTYNERVECSAEYVFDTEQSAPTVGSDLTIGGNKYRVTEVTETEDNQSYRRLSFRGVRYKTNTIPA